MSTDDQNRIPEAAEACRSTRGIPSADEICDWQKQLVSLGPKYTENLGHSRYVDWLCERFADIPGFTLKSYKSTH
jgi:disulfide oxidoreductase YuzD